MRGSLVASHMSPFLSIPRQGNLLSGLRSARKAEIFEPISPHQKDSQQKEDMARITKKPKWSQASKTWIRFLVHVKQWSVEIVRVYHLHTSSQAHITLLPIKSNRSNRTRTKKSAISICNKSTCIANGITYLSACIIFVTNVAMSDRGIFFLVS